MDQVFAHQVLATGGRIVITTPQAALRPHIADPVLVRTRLKHHCVYVLLDAEGTVLLEFPAELFQAWWRAGVIEYAEPATPFCGDEFVHAFHQHKREH